MFNIQSFKNINRRQVLFVVLISLHVVLNFSPWINSYSSVMSGDTELGGSDSELKRQCFQYVDAVDLKNLKGRNANKK